MTTDKQEIETQDRDDVLYAEVMRIAGNELDCGVKKSSVVAALSDALLNTAIRLGISPRQMAQIVEGIATEYDGGPF